MIVYTDLMIFPKAEATTWGPFIFIRPRSRGDEGLLAHEQVHVRQWKRNPFMFVPYLLSKKARLKYEAEAYAEQAKHHPDRMAAFARALATQYRLGISEDDALKAILDA